MIAHRKFQFKYCAFCAVISGVTYLLLFKTLKIQKLFNYVNYKKWFFNQQDTYLVSSSKNTNVAVNQLRRNLENQKVLGLDCEWLAAKSSRNPVALLQLAAPNGFCSLFRLCCMENIPTDLKELLEDKDILKVGVAVVNDANFLFADYGIRCEGCLDLRHLAVAVDMEPGGLAYLAKHVIGIELNKDWRVRCSNWESETLTPTQVQYAAQDAQIATQIFEKLNHKMICQRYNTWRRLFWSKSVYWHHSYNLWTHYIGLSFSKKFKVQDDGRIIRGRRIKPHETVLKRNLSTLPHNQHYSNIFLLAPDEQVLCTINNSKAAWYSLAYNLSNEVVQQTQNFECTPRLLYLERGLVDIVKDDPKTLKLRFEPSKRTSKPDGYYTKPKENKCVVCGSQNNLRRKNVVPCEYKKNFQDALKNHHSHDVLLVCLQCHIRSNLYDQALRDQLVKQCDAPLADGKYNKFQEVVDLRAVKSAARALFYNSSVIPEQRKTHLRSAICTKLGISSDQLTTDALQEIINIDCFLENEYYRPHGLKVVEYYKAHKSVDALERKWRQHFLETMRPQYLPQLWSVNFVRD